MGFVVGILLIFFVVRVTGLKRRSEETDDAVRLDGVLDGEPVFRVGVGRARDGGPALVPGDCGKSLQLGGL